MTPDEIEWLTWGAIQHRPRHSPRWDHAGTHKAITEHCGTWGLAIATEHVLAHARDPKARTPFAIKGNPPHTTPQRTPQRPARAGEDCPRHPGEWPDKCRACAADALVGDESLPPRHVVRATSTEPTESYRAARAAVTHPRED